jgi:hypothetical protein
MYYIKVTQYSVQHSQLFLFYYLFLIVPFETIWKNIVEPDTPQMTIRRMRNASQVTKATNTHSEYVTVNETRLNVTLHVHRLSCNKINVQMASIFLIKNNNTLTPLCHYFERNHSLCCYALLSFVSKTKPTPLCFHFVFI